MFRLISTAEYAFKICLEVSTYLLSRDKIWNLPWTFCLLSLHSNSILLELFASTVGWFLSRIKYLPSYVFLWRCPSFTLQWWGQSNPTQWFSCSRRRNALRNMPLIFVSCLSISSKNLDALSSTCFLSKFWYLRVACTIYLSVIRSCNTTDHDFSAFIWNDQIWAFAQNC